MQLAGNMLVLWFHQGLVTPLHRLPGKALASLTAGRRVRTRRRGIHLFLDVVIEHVFVV
jgi:hypothetical protein